MITLNDVAVSYRPAAPPVFSGINHTFAPGSLTVIAGPSGRGKSTLLYLLGLMLRPTTGHIQLGGVDTTHLSDHQRSRIRADTIGFVFQDALLDPSRTVVANILQGNVYGPALREAERLAGDLMARFGIAERGHHRPGEISGGQAQRVALCRALIKRPAVILADEPTGNLDPQSGDLVWNALQEQADQGATVIIATHDPRRIADAARPLLIGI